MRELLDFGYVNYGFKFKEFSFIYFWCLDVSEKFDE